MSNRKCWRVGCSNIRLGLRVVIGLLSLGILFSLVGCSTVDLQPGSRAFKEKVANDPFPTGPMANVD